MFSRLKVQSSRAAVAAFSAGVALVSAFAAGAANATLDPSISTGITGIQTDATSLNGLVMPVVVAILGMIVVYKLVKRFGNKI